MLFSPMRRTLTAVPLALPLALLLAGCGVLSAEESYADRDWSAAPPVVADVPQVREPTAARTRANLRALDPCAIGAAGDADSTEPPGERTVCTALRSDGTVEVDTAARYYVEGSGPDAINALDSRDRVEIAGVAAWVGPGPTTAGGRSRSCAVVVPASLELALVIADAEPDCGAATAAAEAAIGDLGSMTRPGRDVTAPVFYAADEPDPGGVGGCAHLGDQRRWLCAPVDQDGVDVPADPVDLIRRGEVDPQVLCLPALEAARETAATDGRSWVAMTTTVSPQDRDERSSYDGPRQCTLVAAEDDGGGADANPATILVSARREPLGTQANTEVSGHPAYHAEIAGAWEIALTDPTEHGYLSVQVLDTERSEPTWAEDLVEDLVRRTLG
ncbi:hypothetical protein GGQ22_19830 [Nocardioides sp. zg-579]|uniref:DUF3558 domain-containing protein n=1 Tax=Nocardioides marmotae TaxID=2663857 RepID=A0A6I3JGX3_9ACTN|nr:hypothetical protein [Nocardioides marmotae]MCR6033662.1 hypothetical protein [Gordonia jinghuaiqii]MTB97320.1 hypothetical protein [Nocardioides marmotae]QKE01780.1 hypothetical protein HPC71_12420 [Nocardioides marmotae]